MAWTDSFSHLPSAFCQRFMSGHKKVTSDVTSRVRLRQIFLNIWAWRDFWVQSFSRPYDPPSKQPSKSEKRTAFDMPKTGGFRNTWDGLPSICRRRAVFEIPKCSDYFPLRRCGMHWYNRTYQIYDQSQAMGLIKGVSSWKGGEISWTDILFITLWGTEDTFAASAENAWHRIFTIAKSTQKRADLKS